MHVGLHAVGLAPLTSVVTVGFVTVVGLPLVLTSVIFTDRVAVPLMYFGSRLVLEPVFGTKFSVKVGVTRPSSEAAIVATVQSPPIARCSAMSSSTPIARSARLSATSRP